MSFHSKKCTFFLHSSLSARFDFSRVRIAFSGLLAFTWGFSNWFYSGLKKDHGKRLKIFDRKSISKSRSKNFRKFRKNQDFFDFFIFFENFRKIENRKKLDFNWKFSENFRKKWKNRKILIFSKISKIFENFSISILKSIFDQKFSIFFHDFF